MKSQETNKPVVIRRKKPALLKNAKIVINLISSDKSNFVNHCESIGLTISEGVRQALADFMGKKSI